MEKPERDFVFVASCQNCFGTCGKICFLSGGYKRDARLAGRGEGAVIGLPFWVRLG